jgi:magnesium chelatase subunit I
MKPAIHTLGELQQSGYKVVGIKEEMRRNVIRMLRANERLFPGIVGFDDTVIPQIVNAILAKHDILLLGLRGQAKTRIARQMVNFLDEYTPIVSGSEINDSPFEPLSAYARRKYADEGDEMRIDWIHRSERYAEKLATPDVSVADLIGDIDPIKASAQKLSYADEAAIHYGIIPRSNRGIFTINELPDLQPRIQVSLFNILQERDVQIRGFNIRMPLDVCLIFTANPEDYTRRGSIITPLKDRIDAQILTHYPRTLEDGITILDENAWVQREDVANVHVPLFMKQVVESIASCARSSEYVDHSSGVSARMTISVMEALVSNCERRALSAGDTVAVPRMIDFHHALSGVTGKIELVFEGEQEGLTNIAKALVGKAAREVFTRTFPDPLQKAKRNMDKQPVDPYAPVMKFFAAGNSINLSDTQSISGSLAELDKVPTLRTLVSTYLHIDDSNPALLVSAMEFVLESLHHHSKIAKDESDGISSYKDMVGSMLRGSYRADDADSDATDEDLL